MPHESPAALEAVACNLCGADDAAEFRRAAVRRYGERSVFHVVRCRKCGLRYVTPRPSPKAMAAFYPEEYQRDIAEFIERGRKSRIFRFGLRAVHRRRVPPAIPSGRLLDIGCSNGAYLAAARDTGWTVEGIEYDPAAVRIARDRFGLEVRQGDAGEVLRSHPDGSFDVVTMWHVLEHLFDPADVLAQIRRVLKPDGLLMLEVPNIASPLATILGTYWFPLELPRHLYHFTPRTLSALLVRAGFRAVACRGVPAPDAIVWSLRSLRGNGETSVDRVPPLSVSPVAMALAFPISWLMATCNLSDHMAAVARRPGGAER